MNQYTEEFVAKYDGEITFNGAGSLPMSGTIKKFVKGNYVLVGDAAGMVLPSNGAGITIAMIGGRIAGNVIAEHLPNLDFRWKNMKKFGKSKWVKLWLIQSALSR